MKSVSGWTLECEVLWQRQPYCHTVHQPRQLRLSIIHCCISEDLQFISKASKLSTWSKLWKAWLIVDTFLSSKSSFSVIVQMSTFSSCFKCLFALKSLLIFIYQVNIRITVVIFPDEHLLWLGFTWFSMNILEKSVCLKSDHQDLLRNVCFQKLYFHCSSAEEWSSSHIFWGAFISSSLNQHWIALHYVFESLNLILLIHIIGDIDHWYLDHFMSVSAVLL